MYFNQNLFSVGYIYIPTYVLRPHQAKVKSRKSLPGVVHGEVGNGTSATKRKVEQEQDTTVVSSLAFVN